MSLGTDRVRQVDAELDRISVCFGKRFQAEAGDETYDGHEPQPELQPTAQPAFSTQRINELLPIVKALSAGSSSRPQLSSSSICQLLRRSNIHSAGRATHLVAAETEQQAKQETDVEWLLVGKATAQVYGLVLDKLLEQVMSLSDESWYWEEVVGSYRYTSLYAIQTSPIRLWNMYQQINVSRKPTAGSVLADLAHPWKQFYGLVRSSIQDRSLATVQGKILSPIALSRREARMKLAVVRRMRNLVSTSIGLVVEEGLSFGIESDEATVDVDINQTLNWKTVVSNTIALMNSVLRNGLDMETEVIDLVDHVFASVEVDVDISRRVENSEDVAAEASAAADGLLSLLEQNLPDHEAAMARLVGEHGRPSPVVRYWLPAMVVALSSSTVLQIVVSRKAELITWARDVGFTVRDFWSNWVITPIGKVVRTIRHDEASEIAIMSRDSLKADQASLERMVVDFALDKPHFAGTGTGLNETEIEAIRAKVGEGDVTPVLRAYEQALRNPLKGAVKGDLVRSLLIQVQKTKVDMEVAIGGIDALLRSQELVFGFVGLTPGILVSIGVFQYLRGAFGGRKGRRSSRKAGQSVRVIRKMDRIFSEATITKKNVLSYRDHGLLLCETYVLRNLMCPILPREVAKEFLEDVNDLTSVGGVEAQKTALERIKWAYGKWLR